MAPVLRLYEDTLSNTAQAVGLPLFSRVHSGAPRPAMMGTTLSQWRHDVALPNPLTSKCTCSLPKAV
jgi:hypothetical protein